MKEGLEVIKEKVDKMPDSEAKKLILKDIKEKQKYKVITKTLTK
jgi:hypothetical protein